MRITVNEQPHSRGLGMKKVCIVIAFATVAVGCGGDDEATSDTSVPRSVVESTAPIPTTPAGDVELCSLASVALPGSADEPATNEELAKSLGERAATLMRIADSSSGDLADALRQSGDAMNRLAEAVASGTDPAAFDGLLTELSTDEKFSAAQTVIDEAVASACDEGDE